MYNSIIKFTLRIGKIYPQEVNLSPVENPCASMRIEHVWLRFIWRKFNTFFQTKALFANNEDYMSFLHYSRVQGMSGKNEQFQTAKHHDVGPPETRAQCSCIGCIGLRPALLKILVSSTIVVWHIVLIWIILEVCLLLSIRSFKFVSRWIHLHGVSCSQGRPWQVRGPMQDWGAAPLWAIVLWRHRVQSTVLYNPGRAQI